MKPTTIAATICLLILAGLAAVGVKHVMLEDTDAIGIDVDVERAAAHDDGREAMRKELAPLLRKLRQAVDAEQDLARERAAEIARLADELGVAQEELAAANEALAAVKVKKIATIDGIMAKLDKLKKSSMSSFLQPGTLTDLVNDLKGMGPEGVAAVLTLMDSEETSERILAGQLLMHLADEAGIDPLKDAAKNDPDEMVATMASRALMLMDSEKTVPALKDVVLNSRLEGAQVNAMYGLCRQGDEWGIERSIAYCGDEKTSRQMKAAMGSGLLLLDDDRYMPVANDLVKTFTGNPQIGGLAVDYYKRIGGDRGRNALNDMLALEISDAVRTAAQAALSGL